LLINITKYNTVI